MSIVIWGSILLQKMSLNKGTNHLAIKGRKAVIYLLQALRKYKDMSCDSFIKIFDTKIQPMLLYSSEIWGCHQISGIEKVHMLACKRFLKVPIKTPNKMIYGDLGRFPLFINSQISCLRYWFRLLEMEEHRLPRKCYEMLLELDRNGKDSWVSNIRDLLSKTGYYFVWLQQGVQNV